MQKINFRDLFGRIPLRYESLPSEPADDGGAESRTSKQSPQGTSPVTPEVEPVLSFIADHLDEQITYDQISRGSGVQKDKVGRIIRELVEEGVVVKSAFSPRHGTRYWINGSLPKAPGKNTETSSVDDGESEVSEYVNITSNLIWLFIRETRSTDVLMFLTWLEERRERYE